MQGLHIFLTALEAPGSSPFSPPRPAMEFHISRRVREEHDFEESLFRHTGNVILPNFYASRVLAQKLNSRIDSVIRPELTIKAGQLNAMGLIDEILHHVIELYRRTTYPDAFEEALERVSAKIGKDKVDAALHAFVRQFPPLAVYEGEISEEEYLGSALKGVPNKELALEELLMLYLANDDPAFSPFGRLFDDADLRESTAYLDIVEELKLALRAMPEFGPEGQSLFDMLKSPVLHSPHSLPEQLEFIRSRWGLALGDYLLKLLSSLDMIREEEKPFFPGPGPTRVYVYAGMEQEYERFSPDKDWMPRLVMIAKSTLVWLDQLGKKYRRAITRLDAIPDEELDILADSGFTGLWLIGLWQRSAASRRIKQICGNPEAAASAYSLFDYEIADELGGWNALADLRKRCMWRGIRLAADMVPNHTGMDSNWVSEHPEYFIQLPYPPFPGYSFNGENLSSNPRLGIYLEDHYYGRSDASVVFKRVDFSSGDTRYIYHGNDGTGMPWNDTAQIDFLDPRAREAVIQRILHVAANFAVIRFDAAMVLAKKHIKRLWYPEPGQGGDIASRAEHGLSAESFERRIPNEFWREVVDRCAEEAPDTLLLAEAFWMLEGYFVRTLGMHRVYNSAFMNMLKKEENGKYRSTIKNTQEFDREILKRFVNFLNNPDEETALAQFGKGDKYFGICTMMVTMPGLPMFGHGQIEGFAEKYGMEFRKAYWNEEPDGNFVERHRREVFPLMKKRYLFAEVMDFLLYDLWSEDGSVNENCFAYSNRAGRESGLVLYNNSSARCWGWIRTSAAYAEKLPNGDRRLAQRNLSEGLGISGKEDYFVLMREQRSGLWFIRKSGDIAEKGMFVSLEAYQSQVFIDIYEIADNELGQYGKLYEHLAGKGVQNIETAMQDVFLRDLYRSFMDLASPEYFNGFRALVDRSLGLGTKRSSTLGKFKALMEGKAMEFCRTARMFIAGTEMYDPFTIENAGFVGDDASILAAWNASLDGLFALLKKLGGKGYANKAPARSDEIDPRVGFVLSTIGRGFEAEPEAAGFLAGFLLLDSLRFVIGETARGFDVANLIDHWCLDRKLREAYRAIGIPEDRAWRTINIMKTAIANASCVGDRARAAQEIFSDKMDESVARIIGVNTYDGVTWFNKEAFEWFIWYFTFALFLEPLHSLRKKPARSAGPGSPAPVTVRKLSFQKKLEGILSFAFDAGKAETESEYRLDKLREKIMGMTSPAKGRKRTPYRGGKD